LKEVSVDSFECDRLSTCCFSGHRSRDLPFKGDLHKQGMKCLYSTLQLLVVEAVSDGFRTFISGMSDGVDLICADIVRQMMISKRYGDIRLVCALPYREQYNEIYTALDKYKYSIIIDSCSERVIVSEKGDPERYKLRNRFMVDNSSRIIGVMKEKQRGSGTLQTLNMAKRAGIEMKIISLLNNPQLYVDTDTGIDRKLEIYNEKNLPL